MDLGSVEGRGKMETLKQDGPGLWGQEVRVKPGAWGLSTYTLASALL